MSSQLGVFWGRDNYCPTCIFKLDKRWSHHLEDRKRQQQDAQQHNHGQSKRAWSMGDTGDLRGGFRSSFPRQSPSSVASVPSQSHGRYREQATYSNQCQNFREQSSQNGGDSSRMRSSMPCYGRCGKNHFGQCLHDLDLCYSCGQPNHIMCFCPVRNGSRGTSNKISSSFFIDNTSSWARYTTADGER